MIRRAYQAAVEQLRISPRFPLLVPTLFEVAAQYRRAVPEARLAQIKLEVLAAGLLLADAEVPAPPARPTRPELRF